MKITKSKIKELFSSRNFLVAIRVAAYIFLILLVTSFGIYLVFSGTLLTPISVVLSPTEQQVPKVIISLDQNSLVVQYGAEINLIPAGKVPMDVTDWQAAFDQTIEQAVHQNNTLFILYEQNEQIFQNTYTIDSKFQIEFSNDQFVRKIASVGSNVIAFIDQNVSPIDLSATSTSTTPQRLKIGDQAYVCLEKYNLRVRSEPGYSADIITSVAPGTLFTIIDGPYFADDWPWWRVRISNGIVGWVVDGGDDVDPYFICPVD